MVKVAPKDDACLRNIDPHTDVTTAVTQRSTGYHIYLLLTPTGTMRLFGLTSKYRLPVFL